MTCMQVVEACMHVVELLTCTHVVEAYSTCDVLGSCVMCVYVVG